MDGLELILLYDYYGNLLTDRQRECFELRYYQDQEFMDNHREIIIYTPEHILTYKVFSAVVYDDRHLMLYYDYENEKDRQAFIDSIWNSRDMRNYALFVFKRKR